MERISLSILAPVCQRVINIALEEYRLVSGVKEEIKNLRTRVEMIEGLLEDAERKKDGSSAESSAIRIWLKSLKQVLFDAEDILDEIATDEALGRDAEDGGLLSKVRFEFFSIFTRCAIAHRVKDINKKFDEILKDNVMSVLNVSDVTSGSVFRRPRPDTSSLLPSCEAHIIGRDGEMQKIEELLLEYSAEETVAATSDNYKNVHVISVVGMGGVGKTTLVKHAYNSPAVAEYFQLRMWVCVSNYFDVERITREIIDAVASSSKETRDEFVGTSNTDVVENRLKGKLEGKRFLLVLDDVWEEDPSEWDRLCTPLMYGRKGSKLIVTTRSQKVVNNAKGIPIFLKDLSTDDLWSIFQTYAFDGHDPDMNTQLVIIGRQIVDKLKGSPLAAKTIGRLLNSNQDVKHWKYIMESKTWVSPNSKNSIVPILKLSYDYLPGHLKQCFAYCSLFPEDHKFDKDELVQLWMAQQFIQSHVESMGGECYDDLACMSLFEKYTHHYGHERFVMHDLIHKLAEIVSEEDCLRLEDNQQNGLISDTVRHVSIASNIFDLPKIEQLCNKYENMRTLLFLRGCKVQLDPHLGNIFTKLQRLRVLGLSRCGIKELHASIGALKHLRLLDLSFNSISKLPDSLCNLHNLQVLNLKRCGWISALPRNMRALINLRHLIVKEYQSFLVSGIEGLGKLTALHELTFFCGGMQPMKELADMGMLRQLRIESLEKVKSREDAAESRLDKKEHLDELTLVWRRGRDNHLINLINPGLEEEEEDRTRLQAEVLDGLQPPHSSIRRLTIKNYGGSRSPSWMEDQSWLRHSCFLSSLELFDCKNWEVLPPLGQLPCLDSLKINGMRRVRRIGPAFMGCCRQLPQGGFPSLQVLEFANMEEWEEWEVPLLGTDIDDGGEDDQVVLSEAPPLPLFLARLRQLTITNCPKLRQLPPLPPTLTKLHIWIVGLTHLPEWWLPPSSSSSSLLPCSSSSPCSLSSLKIGYCRELTSLADGLLRHPLPNLVNLIIRNCEGLVSLPPDTAFGHLTSLKELWVAGCPKLAWASTCESPSLEEEEEEDTGLPPSLESITIEGDRGQIVDQMMLAIVGSRQKLACLRKLMILGPCFSRPPPPPTLRRSLPSSLQQLIIRDNHQLDDETLSAWLRGLTSLRQLDIGRCPALGGVHCLVSLEELTIGDCPELLDITTAAADSSRPSSSSSLPSPARSVGTSTARIRKLEIRGNSSMQQIKTWLLQCPSLQELHISRCPQLTGLGGNNDGGDDVLLEAALLNLSGTLIRLDICICENLRSLPPRLRCLSSLQSLSIGYCPQIRSLPVAGLPESLRDLIIYQCPALEERCKEGVGSDWPLISHIPTRRFGR